MDELTPTARTTPHRYPGRVSYDAALVHAILDEALISHLGLDADGPLVLPVIHARVGQNLYVHVSTGAGIARRIPAEVCLTATIVDGLVLAKSQFHHSMNYRSVVVRGRAEPVGAGAERDQALAAIVDHVAPGRSANSRPPNAKELAATFVLRIPLLAASAKVRAGPAVDDDEDLALPYWAGVIPTMLQVGAPVPGPQTLAAGTAVPPLGTRFAHRRD